MTKWNLTALPSFIAVGSLFMAPCLANADVLIDDFTAGEYHQAVEKEARANLSGNMLGGSRSTYIAVTRSDYGQTANVDVLPKTGVMAVNTGINCLVRVELRYGYNREGKAAPLNLDLTKLNHIRIDFVANDRAINFNIVLFSRNGSQRASMAKGIAAKGSAHSVKMPLAEFSGTEKFDFADVDHIAIIFQSTGPEAGNDYVVSKITIAN